MALNSPPKPEPWEKCQRVNRVKDGQSSSWSSSLHLQGIIPNCPPGRQSTPHAHRILCPEHSPMRRKSFSIEKLPRSLRIEPHRKIAYLAPHGNNASKGEEKTGRKSEVVDSAWCSLTICCFDTSSPAAAVSLYTLSALTGWKDINQGVRGFPHLFSILSTSKGSLYGKSSTPLLETQKTVNKEVSARNWKRYLRNWNTKDYMTASKNR